MDRAGRRILTFQARPLGAILGTQRDLQASGATSLVGLHILRFAEVAPWLKDLQHKGKIGNLGVTNFDRTTLSLMFDAGVWLATRQLQDSVLDRRPENKTSPPCQRARRIRTAIPMAGAQEEWTPRSVIKSNLNRPIRIGPVRDPTRAALTPTRNKERHKCR
jgi:hypothetical protein